MKPSFSQRLQPAAVGWEGAKAWSREQEACRLCAVTPALVPRLPGGGYRLRFRGTGAEPGERDTGKG